MQIESSIALVTGANRGLGAALAEALLARGAAKVYAGVRNLDSVTDPRLAPIRLDLTDRASIAAAAATAADVTLLINNAGVDTGTPTLGDECGLRDELEINYLGPVAVNRVAAATLDALEADEPELLVDDFARHVRAGLSGPLETLYPALARSL